MSIKIHNPWFSHIVHPHILHAAYRPFFGRILVLEIAEMTHGRVASTIRRRQIRIVTHETQEGTHH